MKLEKVNIIPWVDYIFGYYQEVKNNNSDIYNAFPPAAYEKNNNYELKKQLLKKEGKSESEIIKEIKNDMDMMSIGIIPMQLFKNPSKKERKIKNIANRKEIISKSSNNKSASNNFIKDIKNFLKLYLIDKAKLFLLKDNYDEKLIIQFKKNLYIFRLFNNENKNNIIKKELWKKKQIKLLPLSKMVFELSHDVFLSCRYLGSYFNIQSVDKNINIFCEDFVTCIKANNKENSNTFYTGLFNGKLIEWELSPNFELKEIKHIYSHSSSIQILTFPQFKINIFMIFLLNFI